MPQPLLTVTPATVGNALIQATLARGQALCDPTNRGRHVIPSISKTGTTGKIVFQQGPGNSQNPTWSTTSFAGDTVIAKGDILCVLASIINMIGLPDADVPVNPNPGQLAVRFNALTGTPPKNPYNTNRLLKGILNKYGLVVYDILPRSDFFQYILDYTGYVILFGKGGSNNSPPFINNGHWVYIRSYDPATDLYHIGQSFGNQGALLDHTRGYKATDLIKPTPAEGGVVAAYGVMLSNVRRQAASTPLSGPSTTAMSWETSPSGPARTQITDFTFLGLGNSQEDGNYRSKTGKYGANYQLGLQNVIKDGVNVLTSTFQSDVLITDETWGNGTFAPAIRDASGNIISGGNDAMDERIGDIRRWRIMGKTPDGYTIYRDNNLFNRNLLAIANNQPPPFANVLFIALSKSNFEEGQFVFNPNATAGYIAYESNPDGTTKVPAAADQWTVVGFSPEGYALYINLSQARRNQDGGDGAPQFIRLDGNYISYTQIRNPSYDGAGGSQPYLITQIPPGPHSIYVYDKDSATLDKIANISIATGGAS